MIGQFLALIIVVAIAAAAVWGIFSVVSWFGEAGSETSEAEYSGPRYSAEECLAFRVVALDDNASDEARGEAIRALDDC